MAPPAAPPPTFKYQGSPVHPFTVVPRPLPAAWEFFFGQPCRWNCGTQPNRPTGSDPCTSLGLKGVSHTHGHVGASIIVFFYWLLIQKCGRHTGQQETKGDSWVTWMKYMVSGRKAKFQAKSCPGDSGAGILLMAQHLWAGLSFDQFPRGQKFGQTKIAFSSSSAKV